MANHQANVRFLAKLNLIVGVASRLAEMNNVQHIPAVQFTLGRLAAMQATLEGLIMGQINCGEAQVAGYHTVNRRYSMPHCIGAPITTPRSATPCAS
jgi:4-hydroxyphenylacetate 3-monooxygenase